MKLVVVCVETKKSAQTDISYIDRALKNYYVINNDIRLRYKYFSGKGNYGRAKFIKDIEQERKAPDIHSSFVVYCIDTDSLSNPDSIQENKAIESFCKTKGFHYVWMCEDVEEVFLHKKIPDSKKVEEAKKFGSKEGLGLATTQSLSSNQIVRYKSNLLVIFDQFLQRKV